VLVTVVAVLVARHLLRRRRELAAKR